MHTRRTVLAGAGALPLTAAAAADLIPDIGRLASMDAREAAFTALYDVDRTIANFDAGYYGAMTRPVHAAYLEHITFMNRHSALFLRNALPAHPREAELDRSRAAVAGLLGCATDEIALSTGATEALYALIVNYRPLAPGDAVICADIDYDEMQHAMAHLARSRGVRLVRLALPEPHTEANLLAAYDKALRETPRAKLLLLTHVSNRNGVIPPVRAIIAMARARGVDTILDSAQALGLLPFTVDELGADFVGFSLHKWIAAPLGNGGIYVRRDRMADMEPFLGNLIHPAADVRSRVLTGTPDFAARLTIADAVAVHRRLGVGHKLAHLRALRDHWVAGARAVPGVEITVPDEPGRAAAMTSFRLPGMRTLAQAQRAQTVFLERHRLLVVAKGGLASGPILRVTPSLFNTRAELDRLVHAIHQERHLFA